MALPPASESRDLYPDRGTKEASGFLTLKDNSAVVHAFFAEVGCKIGSSGGNMFSVNLEIERVAGKPAPHLHPVTFRG